MRHWILLTSAVWMGCASSNLNTPEPHSSEPGEDEAAGEEEPLDTEETPETEDSGTPGTVEQADPYELQASCEATFFINEALHSATTYDSVGDPVRVRNGLSDGEFHGDWQSQFEDHLLVRQSAYWDGAHQQTSEYGYDDQGRVVSHLLSWANTSSPTTTTYGEIDGGYDAATDFGNDGIVDSRAWVFVENGDETEWWSDENADGVFDRSEAYTYENGRVTEIAYDSDFDGNVSGGGDVTYQYSYRADGQIAELVIYSGDNLTPNSREVRHYDENGRVIAYDIDFLDDGTVDLRYRYEWSCP